MKQRIKNLLIALTVALSGSMVLVPAIASADFKSDACSGVNQLNGNGGSDCSNGSDRALRGIIKAVIQILSVVVGFIAVVMVIVGGLKYITANGDSSALATARNTIVYALIGLVVVALAQVLVHFVIFKTSSSL